MLKLTKYIFILFFVIVMLRVLIPSTTQNLILQKIEFGINISLIGLCVTTLIFFLNKDRFSWLFMIVYLLIFWVFTSNTIAGLSVNETVISLSKYLVPIICVIAFLNYYSHNRQYAKLIHFLFMICLVMLVFIVLTGDPFFHGSKERLPLYFGTLHDNGYISACVALYGFFIVRYSKHTIVGTIILSLALYLMFGYKVRTAYLVFSIVVILHCFNNFSIENRKILFVEGVVVCIIASSVFFLAYDNLSELSSSLSSGRTSAWVEQLQHYSKGSVVNWVVGFGGKGDFLITNVWQWEAKDAHNTVLSLLIRYGFVGLLLFTYSLWKLYLFLRQNICSFDVTALFLGYCSSLIVSNGLFGRTVPSIIFFMLFIVVCDLKSRESQKNNTSDF